jgi:hypothetical protein
MVGGRIVPLAGLSAQAAGAPALGHVGAETLDLQPLGAAPDLDAGENQAEVLAEGMPLRLKVTLENDCPKVRPPWLVGSSLLFTPTITPQSDS